MDVDQILTNLTEEQLNIVAANGRFKDEAITMLSSPNALLFQTIHKKQDLEL